MKTVNFLKSAILVLIFGISSRLSAQVYDQLSQEVRDKMDQNKIEGKPIMDGIYTHYEMFFWGADTQQKRDSLVIVLQSSVSATSISYDAFTDHFSFVCPSVKNTDTIKNNIIPVYEINHIYKEEYSLSP